MMKLTVRSRLIYAITTSGRLSKKLTREIVEEINKAKYTNFLYY